MRERNTIFGILEGVQRQIQSIDCRNRVFSCKGGNRRLLVKNFKLKSIKKGGKIPFQQFTTQHNFKAMSSQVTNNYTTVPTFFNPYVTRKLNNINEAKLFKKKCDD